MSSSNGEGWVINNDYQRQALLEYIERHKNEQIVFQIKRPQRTTQQNRGLYAFFNDVADQLSAAGHDMKTILKDGVAIEPTPELIKKYMWMPVQEALLGKGESTTQLTTKEVNVVYEQLSRLLASKYGINVRFGNQ